MGFLGSEAWISKNSFSIQVVSKGFCSHPGPVTLGGGNSNMFNAMLTPIWRKDEPILRSIFFRWVETEPPTGYGFLANLLTFSWMSQSRQFAGIPRKHMPSHRFSVQNLRSVTSRWPHVVERGTPPGNALPFLGPLGCLSSVPRESLWNHHSILLKSHRFGNRNVVGTCLM